uniref:Uncharacterized protein n=1 Tax=Sphaerodactylus townsendi TaxID=933632 RepID=A0ACB8EI60_9SAUR
MGHVWTWVESKVDDFFTESEKSSCCQSLLGSTDSSIDLDFSCWRKTEETAEELEESSSPEEDSQMESSDPLAWHSTSEEDQEEAGKFKQDVLLRFLTERTSLAFGFGNSGVHMSQDDPLAQRFAFLQKKTLLCSIWKMVAEGHRYSGPFLKPVSEKQAPGYKDVVKRPVDLSSIKKSLSKGLIQNMVQFQHDLMLMFQNAVMYNSSNHHIHRIAVEMQQEVLEQLQMLGEALLCSEEMRAFVRRC